MNPREMADAMLEDIAQTTAQVEALEAKAEVEIQAIQERCGPKIQELRDYLAGLDKDIRKLMKKEVAAIFEGEDKVAFPHGWLIHGREDHVTIPRDALQKLEALGWAEAIKIAKSVDRDLVEKWPVEKLFAIGAERNPVDKWAYEVKA
jgi:hypothetical protein